MQEIIEFLKNYNGPEVRVMEICGSHTAAVSHYGIRALLSENIKMISGPGCPVCVTVTAYIDRLMELSLEQGSVICTFGDLIRVPGSHGTLSDMRSKGADIRILYSPLDMTELAEKDSERKYIFAAVGFETTAPVYAELLQEAEEKGLGNIRLLTSIKTMPEVVRRMGKKVDGYLLPGHVCTISGYAGYEPLAESLGIPMVAAGFSGENILQAIYAIVKMRGRGTVKNFYPSVVSREGNIRAREMVSRYFTPGDAVWRGLGNIEGSGLYLSEKFLRFDAGSFDLDKDNENTLCRCAKVITGEEKSTDCPLFGVSCTPASPKGACMVSREGTCFNTFEETKL